MYEYTTHGGTPVEAYARVMGIDPKSGSAVMGADRVWKHDACIDLLGCIRYRGKREASERITRSTTKLIEEMLHAATTGDSDVRTQADAVKASLAFVRMVEDQDIKDRVERIRRGVSRAGAIDTTFTVIDEVGPPSRETAVIQLRMLLDQYGEDGLTEIIAEAKS